MCAEGHNVVYLHRENRVGLQGGGRSRRGVRQARGEFIAVFDADFLPPERILRETVNYFADEARGDGADALGASESRGVAVDAGAGGAARRATS